MKRFSRTIFITVAITALISFAIYGARRALQTTTVELSPLTVTLQPVDFTLNISASGELQSAEAVTIAVPPVPVNRLRIASVVTDGRYVNKGDVLVEFDPEELDLQARDHRASLRMAEQKLSRGEMAQGTEKTDITKDRRIAELELHKITEFLPQDQQIYTQRQIIEGQLDKNYAERKVVFADARLQLKGRVYSLDEAILLLEKQQANAMIGRVERALTSLRLLAPAAGIVVYNDSGFFFGGGSALMPGKVVWIGMSLFNLVNPEKMQARIYVLEKDAGEVRTGQSVTVSLDPFPGSRFTGTIKSIDKVARPIDRGSPVKYFEMVVALDTIDQHLMKPGVKLRATIRAGELRGVIVIPRSAVVSRDGGFVAWVQKAPGRFEPVSIKTGQGDLAQVVVTEGLQPGQVLALNPPDVKREGQAEKKNSSAAN